MRDAFGLEADAIWSDDGIIVHLPDADEPPGAELVLISPDEVEDLVVGRARRERPVRRALSRERGARPAHPARLPRAAHAALAAAPEGAVAARGGAALPAVPDRPRDLPRVPARRARPARAHRGAARPAHARARRWSRSRRATASPFASSLLFDYVATYMYEGDTPSRRAPRRWPWPSTATCCASCSGQEELRDLIDPGALEQVEDDLQRRSPQLRARDADGLHDLLRRVGDLTADEVAQRATPPAPRPAPGSARARSAGAPRPCTPRRAALRSAGIAAEDAGLYRDALGVAAARRRCPRPSSHDVPDALPAARCAATRAARPVREPARCAPALRRRRGARPGRARARGELVRGELRPLGTQREWCDPEVLRRLRRASLAVLRREIEPVGPAALARFAPAWQGVDRHGSGRRRRRLAPARRAGAAAGPAARRPSSGSSDVLPRRLGAYSPAWLDELCASGELVWVGAGAERAHVPGRVALYFRDDARCSAPPPGAHEQPRGPAARARARTPGSAAPASSPTCCRAPRARRGRGAARGPLGPRLGRRGHQRRLRPAARPRRGARGAGARRSPLPGGAARSAGRRFQPAAGARAPQLQGRWSLTGSRVRPRRDGPAAPAPRLGRAAARAPRHRDARARARRGHAPAASPRCTRRCGARDASAPRAAATSSRGSAAPSSPCRARSTACARPSRRGAAPSCWPPPTPPSSTARRCAWPDGLEHPPARRAGAFVVLVGGRPALAVEAGGHSLRHGAATGAALDEALGRAGRRRAPGAWCRASPCRRSTASRC